jgi:hypothetical protein
MNLENYFVLDLESSTWFSAVNAVVIDWSKLTEEQQFIMEEGSDTERCLLADEVGIPWTGIN